MRRRCAAIIIAVAMMLGFSAPGAWATSPMTADGVITDRTGTIDANDAERIESAFDALRAEDGVTLWLVVVDDFSNPADGAAWATAFAEHNHLISTDVIMYVGLETGGSGDAGLNVTRDLPISSEQLERIRTDDMLPRLDEGDVAGAAIATADALRTTLTDVLGDDWTGDPVPAPGVGGPSTLVIVLAVIGLAVVGIGVIVVVMRRRENARRTRSDTTAEAPGRTEPKA